MFGICVFMLKPPPQLFRRNVLATSPDEKQAEKLFDPLPFCVSHGGG
jgi:hypothetical protein